MPHKIRLADEALQQITAISDYIAEDSPQNAFRWVEQLGAKIDSLEDFPGRHAVIYSAEEAGREVRQTFLGVYRILYEIQEDTVYILTVRHGARRPIGPEEVTEIQ